MAYLVQSPGRDGDALDLKIASFLFPLAFTLAVSLAMRAPENEEPSRTRGRAAEEVS